MSNAPERGVGIHVNPPMITPGWGVVGRDIDRCITIMTVFL